MDTRTPAEGITEHIAQGVAAAEARIRDHVRTTPLEFSRALSCEGSTTEEGGPRVHLKLENTQRTGSFKFRGAMSKLTALTAEQRARGVVAASSGNHGAAVACGGRTLECPVVVFVPEGAAASKVDAIRDYGAEVRKGGHDCVVAEAAARSHATEQGMEYISPYNDMDVIHGQGTIAAEIVRQLDPVDAIFVALGGGGLISGVGGFLKSVRPQTRVIACSPENSRVMHESVAAGRVLDLESQPTLSDGTAGGVESDSVTFDLCRNLIDEFVLVSEAEIADAVRLVVSRHHTLIEGAAGVAVAGFRKHTSLFKGRNVVVLLCGANIGRETLKEIL